jgi:N6-L-threonylcarbamoyladenine synthase
MNVLGIETSCDETSAAVVCDGRTVLSNVVFTQIAQHRPYGGVVPEIASRSHVEEISGIVQRALDEAKLEWAQVDAVAATYGPGLASSLLVGLSAAKALALRLGKPLIGVNHVEAHLYSLFLGPDAPLPEAVAPVIVLMVSGGHTGLVRIERVGSYKLLGQTLDDAAGEALDKGANLLKLGYPGGPAIEKAADGGDPAYVKFPRGLGHHVAGELAGELDRDLCFSFSGLKTSLLYYLKDHPDVLTNGRLKDIAASYQEAVFDALLVRLKRAVERHPVAAVGCVGGVARNRRLRDKLERLARERGVRLLLARPEFCTDNAAMIAAVAAATGSIVRTGSDDLDVQPDLVIGLP